MFKTVSHIGAAKPVRMTTKIFCLLFPGLDVQDGISHQAAKSVRMTTRIFCLLLPGLDVQDGISHRGGEAGANEDQDFLFVVSRPRRSRRYLTSGRRSRCE